MRHSIATAPAALVRGEKPLPPVARAIPTPAESRTPDVPTSTNGPTSDPTIADGVEKDSQG